MDYTLLLSELNTDPQTLGYGAAGWDSISPTESEFQAIVAIINDSSLRNKDRTSVPGHEIFAAIKPADFLSVYHPSTGDTSHQAYLDNMFVLDSVPLDNANIRQALGVIFSGKTDTLNALIALQDISISRGSELGIGKVKTGNLKQLKVGA